MDVTKYTHKTPAAAQLFSLSTNTLFNYAKRDPEFPQPARIGSRIVLWDVEALRAYFATKQAA